MSALLSVIGLVLVAVAGFVLLPSIFITDAELVALGELPLEESTSHMTGASSGRTLPVAVTDVAKLVAYRDRYIQARKEERRKGRMGLCLLGSGSALQIVGVVLSWVS